MVQELGGENNARSEKLEAFDKAKIQRTTKQMKDTITEMKKALEGINSRLNDTEEEQIDLV